MFYVPIGDETKPYEETTQRVEQITFFSDISEMEDTNAKTGRDLKMMQDQPLNEAL